MRSTLLHDNWTFRNASQGVGYRRPNQPANPWRPAVVPGHLHDDLVRAGVIPDPFVLEHEAGCQWVSEEDWEYKTSFDWAPDSAHPRRILRFEGLDTVCHIWLNGEEIARHDNMFLPLEVEVTDRLKSGTNELSVVFESPVRVGMERRKAYFEKHGIAHGTNWFDERSFVRKVQCMSGWDWGPRLVSCGIWQPVKLLEFEARITSFTVFQEPLPDGKFRVWSETGVDGSAALTTEFDGRPFDGDFDIVLDDPKLWWPNGEGEPHLYDATARLANGHEVTKKIGLRTIRLVQEPDDRGTSFCFEVNGRPIYARGANWIPNDSFPSRITNRDYREQLSTCAKLNMNMLRVWGGGLYELDGFYDACDELGILVWQDFPFACSYYPDDPEQQGLLAHEAEVQIRRLRDRASLALWCGNNENDVMWEGKWGGAENAPPRYFGDQLYAKTLPEVCGRLDPNRPYVRSSPIGGQEDGKAWGDAHYWDVWHGRGDWHFYGDSLTRFSSEFGFCSACGESAWRGAGILPTESTQDDLPVRWHDKTNKPWEIYRSLVELHYPETKSLEDWIYVSQLNQRDALRFGIEHYRTNGYCMGTLIWQFNDCWPVQSWAVQDYARKLKVAGFEMERLYSPVLASLTVADEELIVRVANDGPTHFEDRLLVEFHDLSSQTLTPFAYAVSLNPGERRELARVHLGSMVKKCTVVSASFEKFDVAPTWRTLAGPKEMNLPLPRLSIGADFVLSVEGLLYDAIVDDPDKPGNVWFADQSQPGLAARSILNGQLKLCAEALLRRIRVRSLAGVQELEIE